MRPALGSPASGSELSLLIPSWHAALSDPGESEIVMLCSRTSMPPWPSPFDHRLGTPDIPAIHPLRRLRSATSRAIASFPSFNSRSWRSRSCSWSWAIARSLASRSAALRALISACQSGPGPGSTKLDARSDGGGGGHA
jgi:hypothetical protein